MKGTLVLVGLLIPNVDDWVVYVCKNGTPIYGKITNRYSNTCKFESFDKENVGLVMTHKLRCIKLQVDGYRFLTIYPEYWDWAIKHLGEEIKYSHWLESQTNVAIPLDYTGVPIKKTYEEHEVKRLCQSIWTGLEPNPYRNFEEWWDKNKKS